MTAPLAEQRPAPTANTDAGLCGALLEADLQTGLRVVRLPATYGHRAIIVTVDGQK